MIDPQSWGAYASRVPRRSEAKTGVPRQSDSARRSATKAAAKTGVWHSASRRILLHVAQNLACSAPSARHLCSTGPGIASSSVSGIFWNDRPMSPLMLANGGCGANRPKIKVNKTKKCKCAKKIKPNKTCAPRRGLFTLRSNTTPVLRNRATAEGGEDGWRKRVCHATKSLPFATCGPWTQTTPDYKRWPRRQPIKPQSTQINANQAAIKRSREKNTEPLSPQKPQIIGQIPQKPPKKPFKIMQKTREF